MVSNSETEIILYDLACIKNVCFAPRVWRIRLMLNYKRVPYRTVFLELPDIEPTLKEFGLVPHQGAKGEYTVPAIHHVPTGKYVMDSGPIYRFLEATYPDFPVPLDFRRGDFTEARARAMVRATISKWLMPREVNMLAPRAAEYFRRTREAELGRQLEDLLDPAAEEQAWADTQVAVEALSNLRTSAAEGPFILGVRPNWAELFIAGALQSVRVVDEGVFSRLVKRPGYSDIYSACLPYMAKSD